MTIISNIKKSDTGKSILDSPGKIVEWIEYKLVKQESEAENNRQPHIPYIDLSNCIIYTQSFNGKPGLTNLCDIAGKISCITETHNGSNKFHQEVLLPFVCINSIIYSPFFHQTKFHQEVRINNTIIVGNGTFFNCQFLGSFDGQNTNFGNSSFSFSEFNDSLYLTKAIFNANDIDFSRSIFHGDVFLNSVELKKYDGSSKTLINFYQSVFHKNLFFNKVVLNRQCIFDECQFHGNLSLDSTTTSDVISFINASVNNVIISTEESNCVINNLELSKINLYGRFDIEGYTLNAIKAQFANFRESSLLRIYDCQIKSINFYSMVNYGLICLIDNKDNIKEISFKYATNKGSIEVENTEIPSITDRKTARLLKDSALKSNNHIDAVKYKRLEAKKYSEENDIKYHEKILFLLNGCSNKHGTSWVRALWVTSLITLFFSLLILFFGQETNNGLSNISNSTFWDQLQLIYIGLLNIVNFDGDLKEVNLNKYGYLLLFVSKIFITYGYYQFISAFRKYGK